jgi:hypothetical protein
MELAGRMGGAVRLMDTPGEGCAMEIRLPKIEAF